MMKTRSDPCEITKILRNHISWHFSDDIQEICKPFFEKFQLNYFDYARTVETHIENIKTKLKCRNKSEIFDKAFEFGIGLKLL